MTQPQGMVKGNALQKIGRAGLIVVAILIVMIGLLVLPADNPGQYASRPNPAANYAEAVQRVESLRRAGAGAERRGGLPQTARAD